MLVSRVLGYFLSSEGDLFAISSIGGEGTCEAYHHYAVVQVGTTHLESGNNKIWVFLGPLI